MRNLYDIGTDLEQIKLLLEETDGELPESVTQWVDNLEHEQAEKLDRYAGLIKSLEAEAAQCRKEAQAYMEKARIRENRIAQLKTRLKDYMQRTGQSRMQSAKLLTFSIAKNGGKAPVEIDQSQPIEDIWYRIEKVLDEDQIRKILEEGTELEFAKLGERGTHLRIK